MENRVKTSQLVFKVTKAYRKYQTTGLEEDQIKITGGMFTWRYQWQNNLCHCKAIKIYYWKWSIRRVLCYSAPINNKPNEVSYFLKFSKRYF